MKRYWPLMFLMSSAWAQANPPVDIYQMTGFAPPTQVEIDTYYKDKYDEITDQLECIRKTKLLLIANGKNVDAERSAGVPLSLEAIESDAIKECTKKDLNHSKYRTVEDSYRAFFGAVVADKLKSYGDSSQSTEFTRYIPQPYRGKDGGMICSGQGTHANSREVPQYQEFKQAHINEINGIKNKRTLEKITEEACRDYAKTTTNKHTEFSPGLNGTLVTRTYKEVESLKEALPLIHFSVTRNFTAGHDYVAANSGSSNNSTDQTMKEIEHARMEKYYQAYDGNRFKNMTGGKYNPYLLMRGQKEGNINDHNEPNNPGTAGVIFWQLCIADQGPQKIHEVPKVLEPEPEPQKTTTISLVNENVAIELPNNVVSPFPLVVKNGKIEGVDLGGKKNGAYIQPNLNKQPYFYGPRNEIFNDHEKGLMETAATAMDNKSQEFVDKILGQVGDLNVEKSKIMISSCSNYLRNQPGYVVWSTDTPPIKNDDKNRISFEQLSQNRVDAQYEVLTALVQRKFSEKQKILEDEIKKIQANRALLPESASQSEIAKILEGEISKLQLQVDKIAKIDVRKIKSVSVPCDIGDNKGVAGPNPYFNQLKQKYRDYPAWPNPNSMSKSVYHTEVAKLSKDLKTMDVQDKLALTQKALEGVEDSDAGKIVRANYEDMIKKYKKILAKADGSPAYLDIPLFNDYNRVYPCDPSKPGDNINCDLVTANSKALDGFKVEKMLVDVHIEKIEAQPDRKKPIPDEIPPFIEPGKGKIFHVAAICARKAKKVDQPKKKKESYDYYNTINKPSKASKQ